MARPFYDASDAGYGRSFKFISSDDLDARINFCVLMTLGRLVGHRHVNFTNCESHNVPLQKFASLLELLS